MKGLSQGSSLLYPLIDLTQRYGGGTRRVTPKRCVLREVRLSRSGARGVPRRAARVLRDADPAQPTTSGHQHRTPLHIQQLNRRDTRGLQRSFNRRPIPDDHEVHVIEVDVLLRHTDEIITRDCADLRRVILEVRLGQILRILFMACML